MTVHRLLLAVAVVAFASSAFADELPKVKIERQPLAAQARRVSEALALLGEPLSDAERQAIRDAAVAADENKAVDTIQTILDKRCLAGIHITANKKLETQAGPAKAQLAEQGWRVFLVKVHNEPGLANVELTASSPNALPMTKRSTAKADPRVVSVGEVGKRFLDVMMFNGQPLVRDLSGLELEYRIVQIYCRDSGRKEATLQFNLDEGKKRIASGQSLRIDFESVPAVLVRLHVMDDDGQPPPLSPPKLGGDKGGGRPVVAALTFRDRLGRVYPSPSRRLAPDFNFHYQVYRADGETIALQPGQYTVSYTRGPEYRVLQKTITVPTSGTHSEEFRLQRWIHPAAKGWYSGDHHIHAAGCAHYESPTEGVTPEDMMRHVLGEDLNVGCCLSWGPCWYHQKRYFEGKVNPLSTSDHLLRYDVEVSGFPSSHCGHICLLRLREQDYPGTKLIGDWPSWDLPIFKWAKAQGAVVGFAHSGWGLQPSKTSDPTVNELPNYVLPLMDGIGANEYIVDVTHDACDFISTVDTPALYELNIWYHTLNCGYRTRISGETDFPCIYGERVGLGRSYVHLDGKLDFDAWTEGIKHGRCYVSDGKSHLMDFTVNGLGVGEKNSEIQLAEPGEVEIKAKVAALLEPKPTSETEKIRKTPLNQKPYWDIERARLGDTRTVPVEVVVNGQAVARKEIVADGSEQDVTFRVPIRASSWVALRIFPSSHTNPVFVLVGDKPIRASKRSAGWCLKAVDQCWKQKKPRIRKEEQAAAEKAYEHARDAYKKILAETTQN